jgi:hypothetical protein
MNSPRLPNRRTLRYPLHLPVSIKLADREIPARSENISLNGILLSSDCVIPKGSAVELEVGVALLPDPGVLLTAKGKVIRLQLKNSGDFVMAIECEAPFELIRPRAPRQNVTDKVSI